jgi:DNA-binding NarL/FixJ family response regulator
LDHANCIRCGNIFERVMRGRVGRARVCPGCLSAPGGSATLSFRERQVIDAISRGRTNKEIAFELLITQRTVKQHCTSSFRKMGVSTRLQAALLWLRENRRPAA